MSEENFKIKFLKNMWMDMVRPRKNDSRYVTKMFMFWSRIEMYDILTFTINLADKKAIYQKYRGLKQKLIT